MSRCGSQGLWLDAPKTMWSKIKDQEVSFKKLVIGKMQEKLPWVSL